MKNPKQYLYNDLGCMFVLLGAGIAIFLFLLGMSFIQ